MRSDTVWKISLIPILILPLLFVWGYTQPKGLSFSGDDSTGIKISDSVANRRKSTSPTTWSRHTIDSMFRPTNFYVKWMDTTGEEPWEQVNWDYIKALYENGFWRSRDTAWVLLGVGCLKVRGSLGKNPSVPDTLFFDDTCSSQCLALRTIPLGCYDTVWTEIPVPDSTTICDTLCYYENTSTRDSVWFTISEVGFQSLLAYNGGFCDVSAPGTICMWQLPSGDWVVNYAELTNPNYQWKACPIGSTCGPSTQQKCCINIMTFWNWLGTQGIYDVSPYLIKTPVSTTSRKYVDCLTNPLATKEVVNCRVVVDTSFIRGFRLNFVSAGRDTTILMDTCNTCLVPQVTCVLNGDTTRDTLIKPVYGKFPIYDTTYDTSQCQQIYTVIDRIESYYTPSMLTGDTACYQHWDFAGSPCQPPYTPGTRPFSYTTLFTDGFLYRYNDACVTCAEFDPALFVPQPGVNYCWIDTAVYNTRRSNEENCYKDSCKKTIVWDFVTGNCCPKDTTVYSFCVGPNGDIFALDSHTYQIPNIDSACVKDTITPTITIIGWDSALVRIDTFITTIINPGKYSYEISFVDTCICIPRLNGRELCGDFWIMKCGVPIPWTGNVLNIPCDEDSPADAMTQGKVDSLITSGQLYFETKAVRDTSQRRLIDTASSIRNTVTYEIGRIEDTLTTGLIRPSERDRYAVDSTKITAGANIELSGDPITGYTITATMPSIGGEGGIAGIQGIYASQITLKDTLGYMQFTGVNYDSSIQISIKADSVTMFKRDTSGSKFWNLRNYWPLASDTSKVQGIVDLGRAYLDTSGNGAWYYKLPKVQFDMFSGTRDSSRAWRTYIGGTGALIVDSTGANYTIRIRPDSSAAYMRDTSAGAFWNWSQAGIVITDTAKIQGILGFDTTKFQGLPEADPVFSNALATLRLKSDTSKPAGTVTWTQVRLEIKDSLNLAVKKSDSASYSLGYITFKRLSDTLNANPRVGLDTSGYGAWWYKLPKTQLDVISGLRDTSRAWRTYTSASGSVALDSTGALYAVKLRPDSVAAFTRDTSGLGFWLWSQAPETDPLAVKKADSASYALGYVTHKRLTDSLNTGAVRVEVDPLAVKKSDSASYSLGYITYKRLTDTLNTIPRSSIAGTDTSGYGTWWYKLSKESFDMMMGTRDTSRNWKTIVSLTGSAVTSVDSSTSGRYRYTLSDTSASFIIGQYFALADTNKILSGKFKAVQDSLLALRTKLDSIQTVLDEGKVVCGRTTIGGDGLVAINWPSQPMAVMPTYLDGDPTIPLRWSWSGTQIIIKGDANWEISYCVQGTYSP